MQAFYVSAGVVALGEIGDKTQLLALVLAARFGKPLAIIAGIMTATLVNHALAGLLAADVPVVLIGKSASTRIPFKTVRLVAATLFAALGVYALLAPV
jgi:Ca2+/H+ antiporter, TMEM165/GDT1 family